MVRTEVMVGLREPHLSYFGVQKRQGGPQAGHQASRTPDFTFNFVAPHAIQMATLLNPSLLGKLVSGLNIRNEIIMGIGECR